MEGYLSPYTLVLVLSILANIYVFYRLILLPYFAEVFFSTGSDLIELVVTRRDKKLEMLLDEVMESAEESGFTIKRPKVRILKRGLGMLAIGDVPARACAQGRRNRILFDRKWFPFNDYVTRRAIMAHELGHIVDYQTNRMGHPLFDKIKYVRSELFADAFAAFLYSKEDVISFREPWYYAAFNKEEFLALDIDLNNTSIAIDKYKIVLTLPNTA